MGYEILWRMGHNTTGKRALDNRKRCMRQYIMRHGARDIGIWY